MFPFCFGEAASPPPSDTYSITDGSTLVYLVMPETITNATAKSVDNIVFNDGSDVQLDRGKMSDNLTLTGTISTSADDTIDDLNTIMDTGDDVTIGDLPDTYLNVDYKIVDLGFTRESGWNNRYSYSIMLERLSDRLG